MGMGNDEGERDKLVQRRIAKKRSRGINVEREELRRYERNDQACKGQP